MSSVPSCKQCGCSEIDTDPSRGDAVCTNCGFVLEESIIVSEVTFEEDGHGGASAVGQFVSSESRGGGGISSLGGGGGALGVGGHGASGFHLGIAKESREITLRMAKKRITDVAQQLRLNQHCIDVAFNFFKMALHKQITKGRKHPLTIAACVYMTCRIEGTPHLLIDFSDAVQMDVYALGRAYLHISRALYINIPAVDPCMYILRFAHKFRLNDKTHQVSMTALRLVQRMKRDWIHLGRRPSGLCGAALLIASRLHGFSRSVQDVISVVKVHETTLRKRLVEFGETPSSSLTLDEFMSVDLEEEHDPPAFKAARVKDREHLQKLLDDGVQAELTDLQIKIESELDKRRKRNAASYLQRKSGLKHLDRETEDTAKFIMESTVSSIEDVVPDFVKMKDQDHIMLKSETLLKSEKCKIVSYDDSLLMPPPATCPKKKEAGVSEALDSISTECFALVPVGSSTLERQQNEDEDDLGGELDLTDIDDSEIDGYIMNQVEAERKRVLWESLNNDYIIAQQKKKEQMELDGKLDVKKKRYNKSKDKEKGGIRDKFHAKNANEAIKIMLEKRMSSKINYEVLKSLSSSSSLAPGEVSILQQQSPAPNTFVIESGPVVPKRQLKEDESNKQNSSSRKKVKVEPTSQKERRKLHENYSEDPPIDLPNYGTTSSIEAEIEPEPVVEVAEPPLVIESGPVLPNPPNSQIVEEEVNNYEDEEDEEQEEEEAEHSSARDLLTQFRGEDEESNYDEDYY